MENNKDIFFDINFINDITDGLADEKTESEFFEHIKECSKCRRMYEEAQKIRAIMKEDGFLSETELFPSADFTAKTMEKIRAAKKPTIIRIFNHPAVKTITAAAACLVIALFVFRSDLFGRIEGANDLANEMLSDGQNVKVTADSEEEFDEAAPENGYAMYSQGPDSNVADDTGVVCYSTGAGSSAAPTTPSAENSVITDDSAEETIVEKSAVEDANPITEEEVCEVEEETVCEEDIEEALEEIIIIEPEVADETFDSVDSYPYEAPAANEPVDEFFSNATNGLKMFDIPDSDTEAEVRKIAYSSIARSGLESGAYEKIILITAIDEDINWDGIEDTYPNRFLCIDWLSDGEYNYEVFECTVSDKDDIVYNLFAGNASEILPDIVSGDFSDNITYLIIVKTK